MQQFAIASISPLSVAWIIKYDDNWERLEEIVKYNSAMLGGYYNVFIPLTEENTISQEYQGFLKAFDPDFIVLAPDMETFLDNEIWHYFHPFALVPWESVEFLAALEPDYTTSDNNATVELGLNKDNVDQYFYIAVEDQTRPDMNQFALFACGDIHPGRIAHNIGDKERKFFASGYRERFLQKVLNPQYSAQNAGMQHANFDLSQLIPAPSREKLATLVMEEHQFPLSGARQILQTCCEMEHDRLTYQSFINLTSLYSTRKGIVRKDVAPDKQLPLITILVSEHFQLEDAILFWNLRASGRYVAWLSFSELEKSQDDVARWLSARLIDGYYGGMFYAINSGLFTFAFSTVTSEQNRLQRIVQSFQSGMQQGVSLEVLSRNKLISYDFTRPLLSQEHVVVAQTGSNCTFIPKLPQRTIRGSLAVSLEWPGLLLPQNPMVRDLVSPTITRSFITVKNKRKLPASIEKSMYLKDFRIAQNRYLRAHIRTEEPLSFHRPLAEQIVSTIFTTAGFSRLEPSKTARYHKNFVDRAGSLEAAASYLASPEYRELLEVLSNYKTKQLPGWILEFPSKRRVLHHLQLRNLLHKETPSETQSYFDTVSDELPEEVITLLEQHILERGFLLSCRSCAYRSWYPAEHVGQTFECPRCYYTQVCSSNPLWLYKLAEVIFQGFADHMEVPLLAINYLMNSSYYHFDWIPDSDVYWRENAQEVSRNVDILCLSDGKLYVGEAKSNNEISEDQFSFYEKISTIRNVDGLVFATSQPEWNPGTLKLIERLKPRFKGNVLCLNRRNLYSV